MYCGEFPLPTIKTYVLRGVLERQTHRRMGCRVGHHGVVKQVVASAAKILSSFRIWQSGDPHTNIYIGNSLFSAYNPGF